jgi:hypothetical protein
MVPKCCDKQLLSVGNKDDRTNLLSISGSSTQIASKQTFHIEDLDQK